MSMADLQMVEIHLNQRALAAFMQSRGFSDSQGSGDLGYGSHAWLTEAFQDLAPKPFRIFTQRNRGMRVLGYAHTDAEALRQRLEEFSEPSVYEICNDGQISSRKMPVLGDGRRLGFEVLCCPVRRKKKAGGAGFEKDAFLAGLDDLPDGEVRTREDVYREWLIEQFGDAVETRQICMDGFRLVRRLRRGRAGQNGRREKRYITRPEILMRGELVVKDGNAFMNLLSRGVGRHRAFGYGMMLLRPASG